MRGAASRLPFFKNPNANKLSWCCHRKSQTQRHPIHDPWFGHFDLHEGVKSTDRANLWQGFGGCSKQVQLQPKSENPLSPALQRAFSCTCIVGSASRASLTVRFTEVGTKEKRDQERSRSCRALSFLHCRESPPAPALYLLHLHFRSCRAFSLLHCRETPPAPASPLHCASSTAPAPIGVKYWRFLYFYICCIFLCFWFLFLYLCLFCELLYFCIVYF